MENTNPVIIFYENYDKENRLTTDNARRIEFLTTVTVLDELLPVKSKILDCAAGTGIYSFYLTEKGHDLTALDITRRHIEIIKNELKNKPYSINASVNDARDLSMFEDESFDVVLCMGPLYHLTESSDRLRCLNECKRVLKKDGLLISAYANKFFVIPHVITQDFKYLNADLIESIIETGVLRHDDPLCFWTDTYFYTPEGIEDTYHSLDLDIIDHIATDGTSIHYRNSINSMNDDQFQIWFDYHLKVCREKSIMGISNHGLIVGRK